MQQYTSRTDIYDELLGKKEPPVQSSEYDPYDPLGLSSGRISCTMRPLPSPVEEELAEVFVQDGHGNWVTDETQIDSRRIKQELLGT